MQAKLAKSAKNILHHTKRQ